MKTRSPASPWRDSDLTVTALLSLLGLIAIIIAWFRANHTSSLTDEILWLNVAVTGFAVTAIGLALWLMRGRRAIGERRLSLVSFEPAVPGPAVRRQRVARTSSELVRVPGTRHVHDPDCPLVAGKQVEPAEAGTGQRCGVCAR